MAGVKQAKLINAHTHPPRNFPAMQNYTHNAYSPDEGTVASGDSAPPTNITNSDTVNELRRNIPGLQGPGLQE